MASYHPSNSTTSSAGLASWLKSPITGDIKQVPGVGPRSAEKLREAGITSTEGLIGKFLMMKDQDTAPVEHCERFYLYLRSVGVNAHRADVVQSVAERAATMLPGIYDAKAYETVTPP